MVHFEYENNIDILYFSRIIRLLLFTCFRVCMSIIADITDKALSAQCSLAFCFAFAGRLLIHVVACLHRAARVDGLTSLCSTRSREFAVCSLA